MRELANALKSGCTDVQSSERKWLFVADALIEQWEYQIGTAQQQHNDHQIQHEQLMAHTQQHSYQPQQHPQWHPSGTHPSDNGANGIEMVEVDMETEDPAPWFINQARLLCQYRRLAL